MRTHVSYSNVPAPNTTYPEQLKQQHEGGGQTIRCLEGLAQGANDVAIIADNNEATLAVAVSHLAHNGGWVRDSIDINVYLLDESRHASLPIVVFDCYYCLARSHWCMCDAAGRCHYH